MNCQRKNMHFNNRKKMEKKKHKQYKCHIVFMKTQYYFSLLHYLMNPNWNKVGRFTACGKGCIWKILLLSLWDQTREKKAMSYKLGILRKFHSGKPERSHVAVDTLLQGPWAKVRAVGVPALFGCCWNSPGCPGAGDAGLVFGEAKQGGGSGPCLCCLLLSQERERDAQTVHPFPT